MASSDRLRHSRDEKGTTMSANIYRAQASSAEIRGSRSRESRDDVFQLAALRHRSERSRFALALVPSLASLFALAFAIISLGGAVALAVTVGIVLLVLASVWVTIQIARARLLGGAIRVSPDTFPQIKAVIDEASERLDYHRHIDVWVVEKLDGQISLTSYLGTKMILIEGGLASDLLAIDKKPQLEFLIARFVGALKAKHLRFAPLLVAVSAIKSLKFLNLFIMPYERAVVYSGDQLGLACVRDLSTALGVISRLLVGKEIAPDLGAKGVLEQADQARSKFLPRLIQLFSAYPHLTNRYLNLLRFDERFDRADYERTLETIDPDVRLEARCLLP